MARRTFTNIVLALGLLCSSVLSTRVEAQQVTFAFSPTQVSPAVGDTLKLNITVQNFSNIVSFQYAVEWDAALLSFVAVDSANIPDLPNFSTNPVGGNTVLVGWNSSGNGRTAPNGQRIFRLRLKVTAASSNYWAKFSDTNIGTIEVTQDPGARVITPTFVNLGTPPGSTTIPIGAKTTGGTTTSGQKIVVPVTTTDFTSLVSAKWVNRWNSAILRLDSVGGLNTTLPLAASNCDATQSSTGRMAFAWSATTAKNLVSNDTLYKLYFTAIGANGTNSAVSFDSSEVYRRGGGGNALVALNGVAGTVTVGTVLPPSTSLVFAAGNVTGNPGDTVCMKIKTANFTDIAVMQWSMHFDSTKMTLVSVTSTAGLNIQPWTSTTSQGDFNNLINGSASGTLRFLWVSPNGNGFTLPDSTAIMELCFKYIGAGGTSSTLRFDGTPMKIQVKDGNLMTIIPIFRTGNVGASTVIPPVTFTSVVKNVTCPSGADGTITLTPSGGNGAYTYNWTGPNSFTAATKDIAARAAGKYYVTVTSNAQTKVDSFTITEPLAFATSSQVTHVSCKGGNNGAIVLTVAGGTSPYTYAWVGTTTTPTAKDLAGLTAGIYKLTITDAKNCTFSRADTIKEPAAALTVTTVATNVNCKNGRDGAIVTTVSGGTTPYSYSWISVGGTIANTKDLTNLAADVYNLTVTDAKNCTATRAETITEPAAIVIGAATIVGTRCSQLTGMVTISSVSGGSGGFTYAWAGPNSASFATQNLTNVGPGQYTLTVKDAKNCTASQAYTVVDTSANITNSTPAVTNVTCFGGSDGAISLTATGSGPLTYQWTGPNGFSAQTLSITNLKMGNYTLVLTDAGCNKTIAVSVNEPTAIATAPQLVNVKCKGESSGSIALNASGGTAPLTITWTGPNTFAGTGQSITNLKPGTYVATIKDANLCSKSETITITEPTDSLKITNAVVTNATCNGSATGSIVITVANGTPQYNYTWTGVGGFNSNQKDIFNRIGGDYKVVVTDANGCSATRTQTIIDPQPIVVTASTTDASGAPNGTINLGITGGQLPYTFVWTGQGVSPTAQNQTGLCPGTYNVAVKDNAQCTPTPATKAVTVGGACSTPMRILGIAEITPAGCVGQNLGKININWEGGVAPFRIEWVLIGTGTPPVNTVVDIQSVQARNSMLINRPAGSYALKITDAIGQTLATPPMIINGASTPITITAAISNETCRGNDGSITLTVRDATAPVTYLWNTGQTSQDIFNLQAIATPYQVTVTDANRCIKVMSDMFVRRIPCPLTFSTVKVNPTCFGGTNGSITLNFSNGEPAYTITLPNGQRVTVNNVNTRTGTYTIPNLPNGDYTITVKDTTNPAQTVTVSLRSPEQIVVNKSITGDQGTCNGSIVLDVTGGVQPYTYQWNTGATSRDLFNLCCNDGRRYSVIVMDANGCRVSTSNDSISCNIAALTFGSAIVRDAVCASDPLNSRIDVVFNGGVRPLNYEWRNSNGAVVGTNSSILVNQPPGRYYVVVTDSRTPNPQRLDYNALLKITSTLDFTVVTRPAMDNISKDGETEITITPGVAPYTIRWQDGTTTVSQTAIVTNKLLGAGKGEITVTDFAGCVIKKDATIGSKACATIKINTVYYTPRDTFNIRCRGNNDGSATIIALSADVALPVRTYEWTSGEVGPSAFKLGPGINTVKITDANGKACPVNFIMKAPEVLRETLWVDDKARTLESVPTGGVQPYTYLWNTEEKTRKITATKSGKFVVFVSDYFGCTVSASKEIIFDAKCLEGAVVLTPNDDGLNETFRIKSCDLKKVRLEVYNRWGQLVYSNNDYTDQWQGNDQDKLAGKELPEGVYMYILQAADSVGKVQIGKGTVNIVRN